MEAKIDMYSKMSLPELKKVAKNHKPPIKHYYIKPRLELIRILTMKEFPEEMIIEKMTFAELRKEAKERGFGDIWKMNKLQLLELLYPSSQKNNKNDNHAKKHDDPEKSEGKKIGV